MGKMDEMIIVAPRKEVFDNEKLTFQGVNSDKYKVNEIMTNVESTYSIMRRGDAEENNDFKQPIPYCVLKRNDEVYSTKRLKGGGEARLHNQVSLGLGGHMNDFNSNNFSEVMFENLIRELDEEVLVNSDGVSFKTVGFINDDSNEVGKVHLGLLVIGELDSNAEVTVKETDQLLGEWIKITDLKKPEVYETLETWSQFVADILN
ncbi:hypothetical protein AF332_12005 [Sporosarcina globispora]|uniref:Nudix hydrolase domain-containing protein n=1 Tax=Sporosarcina globispora TaxID=1459 RepID=A0A0M0GCC5_SPOGL|nr:hypothetical protein [Sporosarcina globispora]KON87479.1 hypothetical protein AF332_12005 [Sporosarcina globispora]